MHCKLKLFKTYITSTAIFIDAISFEVQYKFRRNSNYWASKKILNIDLLE